MTNALRLVSAVLLMSSVSLAQDAPRTLNEKSNGYRGVWYQREKLKNEYRYKYSGGLGTYCAKHKPFAVYCPQANKTFFSYGGVMEGYHQKFDLDLKTLDPVKADGAIYHFISYFDHETGLLPRPTTLLDKRTLDAHDNPVISLDDKGYIWVLSTAHGTLRPAYVHRSSKPYSIDEFSRVKPYRTVDGKRVPITNFSYMQVWNVPKRGFVYFFTKYEGNQRKTCFATSADGIQWSNWTQLARIEIGHYQISTASTIKAGCAFNYHPTALNGDRRKRGLNWRTNLYYMETPDFGKTWQAADGTRLQTPLTKCQNPALVRDFEKDNRLVYMKDIVFDAENRPIILFITSRGYRSGPESGPRTWHIARWSGKEWKLHDITTSDSNYDMGSLYIEGNGKLRVVAPTEVGPQPGNPGGEVAMWISDDSGKTWRKERQLTRDSEYNHTYVRRPVNAHPAFYGFWADGHGRKPSPSRLYFCNRDGDVFQLPGKMEGETAKPCPLILRTAPVRE